VIRFKGLVIASQKKKQKKKESTTHRGGRRGHVKIFEEKILSLDFARARWSFVYSTLGTAPDQNFFFKAEGLILTRPRAGFAGARLNFVLLF
jgi:hypothetical protein